MDRVGQAVRSRRQNYRTQHMPYAQQHLFILGSSREDGQTARLTQEVFAHLNDAALIDLAALKINPYSYDHAHKDDDFLPLARAMLKAKTIILASPVYWYSMSAQMKTFFDRLTDLTDPPYKAIGKQLAGKTMFAVASGGSAAAPTCFEEPFSATAGYFGMRWGGMLYRRGADAPGEDDRLAAESFARTIITAASPSVAA